MEITSLTHYNMPSREIIIDERSVTAYIQLIQPINDLFYFDTFKDYAIPLINLKQHFNSKTLEECASLAKENNWPGFQHSSSDLVCYPILDGKLFDLKDVVNDDYEKRCLLRRQLMKIKNKHKRIANSISLVEQTIRKGELKNEYQTLPNSIHLIEEAIKRGEFKLSNEFSFQVLENEYKLNQIDKRNYFNRILDEKCFDVDKLKEGALECKSKSKLNDCILHCQTTNCNMFSVNRFEANQLECCFMKQTFDDFKKQYKKIDNYLIEDQQCSIFQLSFLNKFNSLIGKTVDAKPLNELIEKSPEECAKQCLKRNKGTESTKKCLSFSYCLDKSKGSYRCELRDFNQHNLKESAKLIDSSDCALYTGTNQLFILLFSYLYLILFHLFS